jgi:hypothetical protein
MGCWGLPTFRHSPKSFIRNTYTDAQKCSFYMVYRKPNFFRCNTYKKQGRGPAAELLRTKNYQP